MKKETKKFGYHITPIAKGELGESSKILEEIQELIDAEKQNCKVMAIIELSDIVGAVQAYVHKQKLGVTLVDLEKMSHITKRAFDNGFR